jgi:hypothetical protein
MSGLSTSNSSISSAEEEELLGTPKCPICQNNFSNKVKPLAIQPCGHGICGNCFDTLLETNGMHSSCPLCRELIANAQPNWDLREVTNQFKPKRELGYWEKQILDIHHLRGIKFKFNKRSRAFSKAMCIRIAYDEQFCSMKNDEFEWNELERKTISSLKNALVKSALQTSLTLSELTEWIHALALTNALESYLIIFFHRLYDTKEFLEKLGCDWFMKTITYPL